RDLKVIRSEFAFKILFGLEKFILKRVSTISSISVGMNRKIAAKSERKVLMFPNWVDTDSFKPIQDRDHLKPKWKLKESDRVVLYSGSIGEKQGLDVLLKIAENLKKN